MYKLITGEYRGSTVTLGITGLPVVITGEVFDAGNDIVGLRLAGGNKVYIAGNLIAFCY